jgi:hypothetical protein
LLIPLHHLIAIALGPASGLMLLPAFSLLSMPLLPAFSRSATDRPSEANPATVDAGAGNVA